MKSWFRSKVLWLSLLGIAAMVVQAAIGQQLIPIEYQGVALLFTNIALRFVTDEGIKLPASEKIGTLVGKLAGLLRLSPGEPPKG